jgi:hypothetical protein
MLRPPALDVKTGARQVSGHKLLGSRRGVTDWLLQTEPGVAVLSVVGVAVAGAALFGAFAVVVAGVEGLVSLLRLGVRGASRTTHS